MYYSLSIVGIPAERAREIIPGILELTEGTGVQLQTREVREKDQEKKQEAPLFKYRAEGHQQPAEATKEEPAAEQQAQPEAPAEAPTAAPQVSRKEAKSAAVKKIQEGHKDEVKALVTKYAATGKVDDIPEEKLGEFVAGLAEIGA